MNLYSKWTSILLILESHPKGTTRQASTPVHHDPFPVETALFAEPEKVVVVILLEAEHSIHLKVVQVVQTNLYPSNQK